MSKKLADARADFYMARSSLMVALRQQDDLRESVQAAMEAIRKVGVHGTAEEALDLRKQIEQLLTRKQRKALMSV